MSLRPVLIIEDHPAFRSTLRDLIETEFPGVEVLEAETGAQALEVFAGSRPAVVVVDINIPPPDGLEVTRRIKSEAPDVRALILTQHDSHEYRKASLEAGADCFLSKRTTSLAEVAGLLEKFLAGDNPPGGEP